MLLIGIDGGGTKTEAVLCDETGRVLRHVRGGPSSPTSRPMEEAAGEIRRVLARLTDQVGGLTAPFDAMFAGLSGGGVGDNTPRMHTYLRDMLPACRELHNYNDAVNAFRSAIPSGDGLVAIAGTGSSVFACTGDRMFQTGGWGYLLGDEGSGFDLGRRALVSALRAIDGRDGDTLLVRACEEKLHMQVASAIPALYAGGRTGIADFAPVLLSVAEAGDARALAEMHGAADALCESIRAAAAHIAQRPVQVAIAGSIWKNALYRRRVEQTLGEDYQLRATDLPPVYGSFVIAAAYGGVKVSDETEKVFRETLGKAETI
ncbi:MAG: hypothetical protein MR021_02690 [Clostridiales bacterium]|nr:hypothetical protein [Clostridiales bacterium]